MEQTTETAVPEEVTVGVSQDLALSPVSEEGTKTVDVQTLELRVNIDVLRQFVKELSVQSDEVRLVFNVFDGLRARVVDPAHVSMTETAIAREVFDAIDWQPIGATIGDSGDLAEIGLDVDKMAQYLKGLKTKETVLTLKVDLEKRRMAISGPLGMREMSLIDTTGMSDPKIPVLSLPTEIKVSEVKTFRAILRQAETISDHIAIRYDTKTKVVFLETEGDMDKVQSVLPAEVDSPQDSRSLFPLEYLMNLAKVIPGPFVMEIGNDYPLKIRYGRTQILLAPRIESGD